MEVISIERNTYEVIGFPLRSSKNWLTGLQQLRHKDRRRWLNEVTIWKPNSFINPPNFA